MSYTWIKQNDNKTYSVFFDDEFYKLFHQYYIKGSYENVLYRLFGLLPQDFYHYVGATFHASYRPSQSLHSLIYMEFINRKDAIMFANEIDRRITYCKAHGVFN